MSEEDVFELELSYVETPRGKVSAHETSRKIAEAIVMIQEENRKLEERVRQVEKVSRTEKHTEELRKELDKINSRLEDVMAQVEALKDAFQELIENVRSPGPEVALKNEQKQAVPR